jgi:hypothetical protein
LFTLKHAAVAPLVRISAARAERLADGLYKVSALVGNVGFLPTNMTEIAKAHGTAGTVRATLSGAEVVMGPTTQDLGHLAGRDDRVATWSPWMREWGQTGRVVEWLVRAEAGSEVTLTAGADRAGVHRQTVKLD